MLTKEQQCTHVDTQQLRILPSQGGKVSMTLTCFLCGVLRRSELATADEESEWRLRFGAVGCDVIVRTVGVREVANGGL